MTIKYNLLTTLTKELKRLKARQDLHKQKVADLQREINSYAGAIKWYEQKSSMQKKVRSVK